ncbi:MAG TPA: nitroreductase family protein, partial [Terriglobia bacterium]|nr:nitroreductase family protein [Terriglobia bacterium]
MMAFPALVAAQQLKSVELPAPQTTGGMPLMQALKARHSTREFSPRELPLQLLSNLLWAAFGVNRPESGKRTAPSAMNWQETDIYVAMADGLYVYDAKENRLNQV